MCHNHLLAVFLQKKRSFIQLMGLISLQMRRMWRKAFILSIQRRNNIQRRKRKTMWVCRRTREIQWGRWDCKSIVCHVEVLKLNHEAIVWQIILPDYYSYATKIILEGLIFGGAYIRTSSETQGQSVGPGEKARQKFSSMLENFCRTFSPFPTDCPWVSEDDIRREICPPAQ